VFYGKLSWSECALFLWKYLFFKYRIFVYEVGNKLYIYVNAIFMDVKFSFLHGGIKK